MNRALLITCSLMAAAAAATLSVRACAEPAAKPAPLSQWQEGTNYTVLPNPQAPGVQGKVVVNEVFWYGCGHCYALDPLLESWKLKKPEYVEFVRIPVVWGQVHRQHARLYYTILALGRGD